MYDNYYFNSNYVCKLNQFVGHLQIFWHQKEGFKEF